MQELIEKRFGPIPAWLDEWLTGLSTSEIEAVGLRLMDAKSLEELVPAS